MLHVVYKVNLKKLSSVGASLAQLVECLALDCKIAVSNITRGVVLCL